MSIAVAPKIVRTNPAPRESEARYRALFQSIDDGFCVIEMIFDDAGAPVDYVFLEVNPAFAKHTGIEDPIGRRMGQIAPSHEAHWFEIYGHVARVGESVRFEASARALGRIYDVNAFRVGAPEDRQVAILFKDITERRRLEQQLRDMTEALTLSNRRKDEFLATLAHELRNPLAPIVNALDLLRRPDSQMPVEKLHAMIDRQVGHMVRLVDDLMDIARATQGVLELHQELVDLADVIRGAVEISRPLIDAGRRRLSIATPPEPVSVLGDPTRLVQIVANLLNNAAKYTGEGGRIWLTLEREGQSARLSVRDDGVGIPAHLKETVFDMFMRVDGSRVEGSVSG